MAALQWCKRKLRTFKTEERRKVISGTSEQGHLSSLWKQHKFSCLNLCLYRDSSVRLSIWKLLGMVIFGTSSSVLY